MRGNNVLSRKLAIGLFPHIVLFLKTIPFIVIKKHVFTQNSVKYIKYKSKYHRDFKSSPRKRSYSTVCYPHSANAR